MLLTDTFSAENDKWNGSNEAALLKQKNNYRDWKYPVEKGKIEAMEALIPRPGNSPRIVTLHMACVFTAYFLFLPKKQHSCFYTSTETWVKNVNIFLYSFDMYILQF